MRSGKSLINGTIYKKALSRWWPLGAAFFAANIYLLTVSLKGYWSGRAAELADTVFRLAITSYFPAVFAAAMAMGVYHYLHSTRSAAFMSALPVRREAVFLSHALAGLTLLLSAEVLSALLIPLLAGPGELLFPLMLRWLLISALQTAAYFGLASLCAVLTGHTLAVPALYAAALYGAVALESSLRNIAQYLIFGLGEQRWQFTVLSPVYYLRRNYLLITTEITEWDRWTGEAIGFRTSFRGYPELTGYLIAGAVCLLLAVLLLRKRPAEAAGDVIAVTALRPLFRAAAALVGVCGAGLLLLRNIYGYSGYYAVTGSLPRVALLLFVMLLGGFFGWFGAEMLLRKQLRVFDRHWTGFGVLCALVCLLVLGSEFDLFGVEKQTPPESKVASASVTCYESGAGVVKFTEPENIAAVMELQRTMVENKALFEQGYDTASRYVTGEYGLHYDESTGGALTIRYFDENHRLLLSRVYVAPPGDLAFCSRGNAYYASADPWGRENPVLGMLEDLVNTPEAKGERFNLPEGINTDRLRYSSNWGEISYYYMQSDGYKRFVSICDLSAREIYDLYQQALYPDSLDTSLGDLRLLPEDRGQLPALGNVTISVSLYDGETDDSWFWFGTVPVDAFRTIQWLEEHGIHLDDNANFVSVSENRK